MDRDDDLERLAVAAYLEGRDADSDEAWTRAHREHLANGDYGGAARAAFWLGLGLVLRGETARGGGWIGRAGSVLEDREDEYVETGYLRIPHALHSMGAGDYDAALAGFAEAAGIAKRFADPDLQALATLGEGQTRIRSGQTGAGVSLLDEAMVAVEAREVSPIPSGIVYCAVIAECHAIYDVRRAREWTSALTRWCGEQPDLVRYRGQCLVHRAQVLQLGGAWPDALEEARRACARLADPPGQPAMGLALYQLAELLRLRGDAREAEASYREAVTWGCGPHPGLALLRLAQGQVAVAATAIRGALDAAPPGGRVQVLPAFVEIALAANDLDAARAAADELRSCADEAGADYLRAAAAYARGAVALADGEAQAARELLGEAWRGWQALDLPFEAARTRVLLGLAHRRLGDSDTASVEWDAARETFRGLDAAPELDRLDALSGAARAPAHGLTPRELEVLHLVASGLTNKAIAQRLVLSERTVDRHVSNVFTKLGVSSRAAATAYAYERGLVG